jgi:hypothetical protein
MEKEPKTEIELKFYADGGEVEALKQEGLKASAGEKVGFFERLRMGNIDEAGSEAYNRFGAGRGQRERDFNAAEKQMDDLDAMKKANESAPAPKADTTESRDMDASQQTSKPAASTFGNAFAAARKSGAKTFQWNGKSYTTQMKGQSSSGSGDDNRDMDATRQTSKPQVKQPKEIKGNRNLGRAAYRKRAE